MNDAVNIIEKLLSQAGLHARVDGDFVYLEDPACITRGFEDFAANAWIVLGLITAGLIIGWGLSMIRGAKNDIKENIKNLTLIFGILTASGPILNVIYGGNLFGIGCREIKVSIDNINDILATRIQTENADMSLYEDIDIYDSGPKDGVTNVSVSLPDLSRWDDDQESISEDENLPWQNTNVNGQRAVSASVDVNTPNEIIYVGGNGARWTNTGGNLTWRANNPGALRSTGFTKRMGQIGTTQNGFAIFPDMETGTMAVKALLKTDKYQNRTIAQTMEIYAPWQDCNNPESYAARVARYIGVPDGTYLRYLSDDQLNAMVRAIHMVEGNRMGTIRKI